jgi:hypothetical protein
MSTSALELLNQGDVLDGEDITVRFTMAVFYLLPSP